MVVHHISAEYGCLSNMLHRKQIFFEEEKQASRITMWCYYNDHWFEIIWLVLIKITSFLEFVLFQGDLKTILMAWCIKQEKNITIWSSKSSYRDRSEKRDRLQKSDKSKTTIKRGKGKFRNSTQWYLPKRIE